PGVETNSIFLGVGGDTNLLIAVGDRGTITISPNTITNITLTNIVGTNLVVTNVDVSTLGILWQGIEPRPTTNDLQGVCVSGDPYIVTGAGGTVLTSPDGKAWTKRSTPVTSFLSSVTSFPGGVVAVGDRGTILTSPDGVAWTARQSGSTNWIYRV